ncbi:hypothetical protein ACFWN2_06605 [Lentzea sp. NPDC058436]|uniref:hypothetical protein n=1 Tax=Lentzea sp. NPDC058436 TaxID=3346499 RepID=UPI0036667CA7
MLVNVGTALGLTGVLFLIERAFTTTVAKANTSAITKATTKIEDALRERTDSLASRVDELATLLRQQQQHRDIKLGAVLARLDSEPSFAAVSEALTEANKLGVIHMAGIGITPELDELNSLLVFRWGLSSGAHSTPRLVVECQVGDDRISVEWSQDESAAEMFERLLTKVLRSNGTLQIDQQHVFRHLAAAVRLAIDTRGGAGSPKLRGALMAYLGDDWVLTTGGLVNTSHEYVLPHNNFPDDSTRDTKRVQGLAWPPPPPQWVTLKRWIALVKHGERVFPRGLSNRVAETGSGWEPWIGG